VPDAADACAEMLAGPHRDWMLEAQQQPKGFPKQQRCGLTVVASELGSSCQQIFHPEGSIQWHHQPRQCAVLRPLADGSSINTWLPSRLPGVDAKVKGVAFFDSGEDGGGNGSSSTGGDGGDRGGRASGSSSWSAAGFDKLSIFIYVVTESRKPPPFLAQLLPIAHSAEVALDAQPDSETLALFMSVVAGIRAAAHGQQSGAKSEQALALAQLLDMQQDVGGEAEGEAEGGEVTGGSRGGSRARTRSEDDAHAALLLMHISKMRVLFKEDFHHVFEGEWWVGWRV